MPGTLFVVATPIGNLEDITLRALRVLREVALVAAEDTRRTAKLLARHAIVTPTTSLHEHNETQKGATLLARLHQGLDVALVSDAGTPTVSDPGQRLIRAAIDAGIRIEPIPGPSAILVALVASGFSGDSFSFLGFPPIKTSDRAAWFGRLAESSGPVVFFEAPHRIRRTLRELERVSGDVPAVIGRELTKVHEELVRGPISSLLDNLHSERGEFTIVVDMGQQTGVAAPQTLDSAAAAAEVDRLTNTNGMSRRQAVSAIARKHSMRANQVYEALEQAKKSGE